MTARGQTRHAHSHVPPIVFKIRRYSHTRTAAAERGTLTYTDRTPILLRARAALECSQLNLLE